MFFPNSTTFGLLTWLLNSKPSTGNYGWFQVSKNNMEQAGLELLGGNFRDHGECWEELKEKGKYASICISNVCFWKRCKVPYREVYIF